MGLTFFDIFHFSFGPPICDKSAGGRERQRERDVLIADDVLQVQILLHCSRFAKVCSSCLCASLLGTDGVAALS